jgi:thymidylate synthase ThyX
VLADSIHHTRLTTIEVTFPRIVLAEFNTHRVFSRNSASSRAIPVEKRIAMVEADPFIPESFGKNQKGMQASENLADEEALKARSAWMQAMGYAIGQARALAKLGVHKQLANRLIEPFCWHTVIVSSTEWENFWALRCHPDAQPETRRAAELMMEVYDQSEPKHLKEGEWHLPLLEDEARIRAEGFDVRKVSIGRCARVSYLTHDGKREPQADVELCDRLMTSGHMSPLEHVATPAPTNSFLGNFRGWIQYRKTIPDEENFAKVRRRQRESEVGR